MSYRIIHRQITNAGASCMVKIFESYQDRAWSFLLDSCGQSNMGGRYDILVHSPCVSYQFKNRQHYVGGSWLDKGLVTYKSNIQSPYDVLNDLHAQFAKLIEFQDADFDFPFVLGAIGAFSYDLNTHTDNIMNAKPNQYDMPDVNVGFYKASLVYDNQLDILHICSIQDDYFKHIKHILDSDNKVDTSQASFTLDSTWQANVNEQDYIAKLSQIEEYLLAGDCYQINFAQRFSARYKGCEWLAYKYLRGINKAPFSSFVRLPSSSILSFSPEQFLQLKQDQIQTKPIKGTRKRSKDPTKDEQLAKALLSAEKDRAENLMIVDLLRNDLSKSAKPHSVKVPKLFALESYPAVHHLVSTVVATLDDKKSPYDLFSGAFPGGSITGAPKVRAMQIIQELEEDKRSIYCGSIAYFGIGQDMDSSICIRTMLAENNTLYCWAGGGIVIDSVAIDEYQESLDKISKIMPVLEKEYLEQNNSEHTEVEGSKID